MTSSTKSSWHDITLSDAVKNHIRARHLYQRKQGKSCFLSVSEIPVWKMVEETFLYPDISTPHRSDENKIVLRKKFYSPVGIHGRNGALCFSVTVIYDWLDRRIITAFPTTQKCQKCLEMLEMLEIFRNGQRHAGGLENLQWPLKDHWEATRQITGKQRRIASGMKRKAGDNMNLQFFATSVSRATRHLVFLSSGKNAITCHIETEFNLFRHSKSFNLAFLTLPVRASH